MVERVHENRRREPSYSCAACGCRQGCTFGGRTASQVLWQPAQPEVRRGHFAIDSQYYFTMSARHRGSEQSESAGRRYGVSARLHGELDEDAFDVGLHGLGGNLQLSSDAFVGKSTAHRAQDAVFARTQRLRDARGTSRQRACTLLSTVRENASDIGSELRWQAAVLRSGVVEGQEELGQVRSGIDECLIHAGARANLKRLNEHRTAFGLVSAPEQSVGQPNRQSQCPVVVSLVAARRLKLAENRHSSARVSGGDQYLCTCQGMAGMARVVRGEVARERLDPFSTDRRVARATLLEQKLSAQHQALRHHPRPVARRRQYLRLLQD